MVFVGVYVQKIMRNSRQAIYCLSHRGIYIFLLCYSDNRSEYIM